MEDLPMRVDTKKRAAFECLIAFLASIILHANVVCAQLQNTGNISLTDAIKIAKMELVKIDPSYWNTVLVVEADDNNSKWQEHLTSEQAVISLNKGSTTSNGAVSQLKKKIKALKSDTYWAIYFSPKKCRGKGGDAFVFVNRSEGKILGVILGE
jgi:hypothetical protein